MSQTGYTPIQLYRTATASAAPVAGNLAFGELALNYNDGKLYYKNSAGVVTLLASNYSNPTVISVNSASDALRITQTGAGNALVVEDSTNPDSTPFVVDASGRVIIGATTSNATTVTADTAFQISSVSGTNATANFICWSATTSVPPQLQFNKSNSGVIGTRGAVASGDALGFYTFSGDNGTSFVRAAQIGAFVDGAVSAGSMPGRIVFYTSPSGSVSPTERLRIDSAGSVGIGVTPPAGSSVYNGKNITGATSANAYAVGAVVQSDVTAAARSYISSLATAAASFTTTFQHFYANQSTIGAGSTVSSQYGFLSENNLIDATNNFAFYANNTAAVTAGKRATGFYSNINTATGGGLTYGFYAAGTADNYFGGNVGIGTTLPTQKLDVNGNTRLNGEVGIGSTPSASYKLYVDSGAIGGIYSTTTGLIPAYFRSTDSSSGGLSVFFEKDSASPAASDDIANLRFRGNNSVSAITEYVRLAAVMADPTNGSEDGTLSLTTVKAGVLAERVRYSSADGLYVVDGAFRAPDVYTSTTGTAANMVMSSASGILQRSTSSLRYKNSVTDATYGLAEVMQLRPVTYKGNNDGDTIFGGFIAEEVHDIGLSQFVQYDDQNRPDALAYGNMVSLLTKAMQEQQAVIEDLKARVAALEAK